MSSSARVREILQSIKNIPQQSMNYISEAVSRIFSPRDDDYPATGVQPFEGDPDDKHKD
jgi:hypothetical protein